MTILCQERYDQNMVAVTIKALQFEETNLLMRAAVDNFNWDVERFTSDDVLASS